jgi:nucleoside-diphosphate-sugar epimerase
MFVTKKWVLITGVSGFIGFRLAKELIASGVNVLGVDIRETENSKEFQTIGGKFFNNKDRNFPESLMDDYQIKTIYHLGAIKRHEENLPFDYLFENNVVETRYWAKVAKDFDCRIVFTSSLYVYGNYTKASTESDAPSPRTIYGSTKALAEIELITQININELNCGIARLYFVVGETNDFGVYSNVIHKFIEQGKKGEPISVYGSGSAKMNYVWISDVTKSLISIGNSNLKEIFNVGNVFDYTILEIGELISKKFKVGIEHVQKDWTEGLVRTGIVDKANSLLGISNEMSLEKIVEKILENQEELL